MTFKNTFSWNQNIILGDYYTLIIYYYMLREKLASIVRYPNYECFAKNDFTASINRVIRTWNKNQS